MYFLQLRKGMENEELQQNKYEEKVIDDLARALIAIAQSECEQEAFSVPDTT